MKRRLCFGLILLLGGLLSCKTNPMGHTCGPCPLEAEIDPSVAIKILSKSNNSDLFLSPGSPYTPAQLKVTSSVTGSSIDYYVDTSQTNNRVYRLFSPQSQTFTLKLANLSADSIRIVAKNDSPVCCPILTLRAIWLDNNLVCSPCNVTQPVTIYK